LHSSGLHYQLRNLLFQYVTLQIWGAESGVPSCTFGGQQAQTATIKGLIVTTGTAAGRSKQSGGLAQGSSSATRPRSSFGQMTLGKMSNSIVRDACFRQLKWCDVAAAGHFEEPRLGLANLSEVCYPNGRKSLRDGP
jgi:hypothetical protein